MKVKEKTKKLIIFGDRDFAEIAYEYFTFDSVYDVVAFTLHEKYITKNSWKGLPVVAFERLQEEYSPREYSIHVAVVYSEINRLRARVCEAAKAKGYALATYVSSRAFVWHNATIGENCFVFENNTIQPFVEIQNNVILWSGNHIGHSSVIRDNVFVSSHVVISGFCDIGKNTFLGVNSAIGNHLKVGKECWVGQGSIINKDVPDGQMVKSAKSVVEPLNNEALFRYLENVGAKN